MKKINKSIKRIGALALIAGACVSLSSCGSEDLSHTIVFYHTMGDSLQTVLNTAIEEFQAEYPGWTVQSSAVGGYDEVKDAIIGDLQGGQQPNLAYCYSDHVAQYMQTSKVVDLTKYMNSTETINAQIGDETARTETAVTVGFTAEEIADFVPGYYAEGKGTNFADYSTYGYKADSMLSLPFVKSTEVLYYNEDALLAAGITKRQDGKTVAAVPETWDELWTACEILAQKYPKCTPLGYDSEANWFITMCEQNGWGYTSASGDKYLFNNNDTKAWLEDLNEKYNASHSLFTTQTVYGSYTSNLFVKGAEEGTIFSIGSSGGASHQATDKFAWGVAPIPGSKLGNGTISKKAISQGPNLVMLTNGEDEKDLMTWMFMKHLFDPDFQAAFSVQSGYNPSRQATYEIPAYKAHLEKDNITAVTANVAMQMNDYFFTSPAFVGSSVARTQVGSALVYAIQGTYSAADALANAAKKCGA